MTSLRNQSGSFAVFLIATIAALGTVLWYTSTRDSKSSVESFPRFDTPGSGLQGGFEQLEPRVDTPIRTVPSLPSSAPTASVSNETIGGKSSNGVRDPQERRGLKRSLARHLGMDPRQLESIPTDDGKFDRFYDLAVEELGRISSIDSKRFALARTVMEQKLKAGDFVDAGRRADALARDQVGEDDLVLQHSKASAETGRTSNVVVIVRSADSEDLLNVNKEWRAARTDARKRIVDSIAACETEGAGR